MVEKLFSSSFFRFRFGHLRKAVKSVFPPQAEVLHVRPWQPGQSPPTTTCILLIASWRLVPLVQTPPTTLQQPALCLFREGFLQFHLLMLHLLFFKKAKNKTNASAAEKKANCGCHPQLILPFVSKQHIKTHMFLLLHVHCFCQFRLDVSTRGLWVVQKSKRH